VIQRGENHWHRTVISHYFILIYKCQILDLHKIWLIDTTFAYNTSVMQKNKYIYIYIYIYIYMHVYIYIYIYIAHILRLSTFCTNVHELYKVRESTRMVPFARKYGEKHGAESSSVRLANRNLSECSRNVAYQPNPSP
jgi:hypothetical protein